MSYIFIKHLAGKPEGTQQKCILCNQVINDTASSPIRRGEKSPQHLPPGEVWICPGTPELNSAEMPVMADTQIYNCQQQDAGFGTVYRRSNNF